MSEVTVQGCTLTISSTAGAISAVSVQPSNLPSTDVLVNNKGVFFYKIVAQITTATITPTTPIAGTTNTGILASGSLDINGTASNILDANSKKAVQKGDKGTKSFDFTFTTTSTPPSTTTVSLPVTITVTDSNQTDVIAS